MRGYSAFVLCLCLLTPAASWADGSVVGQIYAPYVQPLEREIEFVWVDDHRTQGSLLPSARWAKLGYGSSWWDGIYSEFSVTRVDEDGNRYEQVELENVWQLTEQGEYRSDWGVMLELETTLGRDAHEVTFGLLNSIDWGKVTLLTNVRVAQEWGGDIDDELETALAMQARYRSGRSFEPSIELFVGEDTLSLGPGATGIVKYSGGRQIRWNAALLKGFAAGSDYSVKLELEYEFF